MPLSKVPGLAGYLQQKQLNEGEELGALRQTSGLMGILSAIRAQQEEQALKGVLAQSGGDPAKAVAALMQAGTPASLALAAKLKGMLPKPAEPYTLGPDTVRYGPDDRPVAFGIPKGDEQIAAKIEAAKIRAEDQRLSRAEQNQARMDMIRLAASLRPAPAIQPLVPIVGPNGQPVLVPREQAIGKTPAVAGSKAEAVQAGKADVDKDVMTLKSSLDELNTGGGITSTEKGWPTNVARWASTTGPGQLLGTMGGTKNQKARDVISQARPLLMRSIMQATGMSAKQLDSNAELKLWLSTATDPTKGYEANIEALNNIASKYGSGGFIEGGRQTSGTIGKPSRRAGDWKDL